MTRVPRALHWCGVVAAMWAVLAVQRGVIAHLPLWGVHGNLLLVVVIAVALLRSPAVSGAGLGFAAGAMADVYSGTLMGSQAVLMAFAGYAAAVAGTKVFRASPLVTVAIVGVLTLLYETAYLAVANAFGLGFAWGPGLLRVALPVTLYNVVLAPLVHLSCRLVLGRVPEEYREVAVFERRR